MRLDFNVLWVDDQPNRIESQISAIKNRMLKQGFEFTPRLCKSIREVGEAISDNIFTDQIDLILVDWDLGKGVHGDDAIEVIRKAVRFKDVVFYSALEEPNVLKAAASQKELEGVYSTKREDLVEEVMGVFESLIKKVLDLDHTRGIVMGATSDIDNLVNQCLKLALEKHLNAAEQKNVLEKVLENILDRLESSLSNARALKDASLDEFFRSHTIFTAYDRLRILAGLLKSPKFSDQKKFRGSVTKYINKVVPDRNILGHLVLTPKGKPVAVIDGSGKEFSLEETRELLCLILELRLQFRNLHQSIETMT